MKLVGKLVPIAIVLLLLGIAVAPSISAQNPVKNGKDKVLTFIWITEDHEDEYSMQKEVTEEQSDDLNDVLDEFLAVVEAALADEKITLEEWETIATITSDFIQSIKDILKDDFPDIDTEALIQDMIDTLLGTRNIPNFRAPIFSIGRGFAWIPFYDYESFFGIMLRPMFITHMIGFTAVFHLNPIPLRFEYGDRLGVYRLTTLGFVGLFINLGDVGFDRVIGPMLLIGKSFNMLGEDLP